MFHYADADKVSGPVTAADLQRLARDCIIDNQPSHKSGSVYAMCCDLSRESIDFWCAVR